MMNVLRSKKGFELLTNWVAVLFLAILVLSFMLSLVIINQVVIYTIAIFAGVILGHFIHTSKYGNRFPYYLLSFAFLIGFLIGHRAGNGLVITVLFLGVLFATNQILKVSQ